MSIAQRRSPGRKAEAVATSTAWQRYQGLREDQKMILRLKALMLVPLHKKDFRRVVNRAALRIFGAKVFFTLSQIDTICVDLAYRELLLKDYSCPTDLTFPIALDAVQDKDGRILLEAAGMSLADRRPGYWDKESFRQELAKLSRQARIGLFTNNAHVVQEAVREFDILTHKMRFSVGPLKEALVELMMPDAWSGVEDNPDWLTSRDPRILDLLINIKLTEVLEVSRCSPAMKSVLERTCDQLMETGSAATFRRLMHWHLVTGHWSRMQTGLEAGAEQLGWSATCMEASVAFLQGRNQLALTLFRNGLKAERKSARTRKVIPEESTGLIFVMALFAENDEALYKEIRTTLDLGVQQDPSVVPGYLALSSLLHLQQGREQAALADLIESERLLAASGAPLARACFWLAQHIVKGEDLKPAARQRMIDVFEQFRPVYPVAAHILAGLLVSRGLHLDACSAFLKEESPAGLRGFADLIHVKPTWELRLDAFLQELDVPAVSDTGAPQVGQKRLAWFVNLSDKSIDVAEQTWQKRGRWSAGRSVAMHRLYQPDDRLDYLTDGDRKAIHVCTELTGWYHSDVNYYFDQERVLPALIGHPAVFDACNRDQQIELVAGEPELVVTETDDDNYHLRFSHYCVSPDTFLEQETDRRYRVISVNATMVRLATLTGASGLRVPSAGKERVLDLCRRTLKSIALRADVAGMEQGSEPGDPRPVVRLQPLDGGLAVSLHVRPFGDGGPYFAAGRGPNMVATHVNGTPHRVLRRMDEEKAAASILIEACPSLGGRDLTMTEWVFGDLESSLEIMLELQNFAGSARIEWPENARVPLAHVVNTSSIHATIRKDRDWFAVSGKVVVDEDTVLEMSELLEALDQASGRFVPLTDGRFLALTESLRQQLVRLKTVSAGRGKHGERLSPLSTLAVGEFLDQAAHVKPDKAWRDFRKRIAYFEKHQPKVPDTLQAELRDYQQEGFAWCSRLAALGAGACLADDMGLGKTVMALALLLERGVGGPALVIAPTSVCHNWDAEARRFAPSLNVHRLGAAADREEMIGRMRSRDILVASYGLVRQNLDALQQVSWHTLVVDEAQAVKNPEAQRTKAVCALHAEFRIALTGTPIENHLDELWSLFRLLNPGLLGSRDSFRKRFLSADPDAAARSSLRALIRPFILRRTKSMVLSELPGRTEQTIRVELDKEEEAFHEALRRRAIDRLDNLGEAEIGKRRFLILSEITRLRRACCHPSLIDENCPLPGAKLETLMHLVENLLEGRHKALVFSQFVGHLSLVRSRLEKAGISYQYLDGSTSARQREERIEAFQGGDGDIFLISLRAGGMGLNLTAADYVIHLDPWWNPAVEDQASDRAHRIGQERPVTIYRLIIKGSIEEKILELHHEKRELADDLLSGTETAARLSEQDLLNLIGRDLSVDQRVVSGC